MVANKRKRKKSKISKNKKKSWNKFCDIQDIEAHLEEKRFEERVGGAAREKSDVELYFLQNTLKDPDDLPIKNPSKFLRCYQNIGAFSKVEPPIDPSKRINKKGLNIQSRAEHRKLKALSCQVVHETKISDKKSNPSRFIKEFKKDMWVEEKEPDPEVADLITFRGEVMGEKNYKIPNLRFLKPSLLPAVQVPHGGASYNPSDKDHTVLIDEAVNIELQKEKKELHLKHVLTDMFPTKAPTEESVLAEMSQGLFDEDTGEVCEPGRVNPPVTTKNRLTRIRRRKQREARERRTRRVREGLRILRDRDFDRLPSIQSELQEAEHLSELNQERRRRKRMSRPYEMRKLSRYPYEPPDLEVAVELPDSLRLLKTEGDLLLDRYKSLQRRNLLEPRIRQRMKRKFKLKIQVKRSHRDT